MKQMLELKEVLELAEHIEENGERFYSELAKRVQDPEVSRVVRDLAGEESGHKALFRKLREEAASSDTMTSFPGDQALFIKALADENVFACDDIEQYFMLSVEDALAVAIEAEDCSIELFENLARMVPPGKMASVNALADIERAHKEVLLKLSNN